MTKLLLQWGLRDQLEEIGVRCPRVDFPDGKCPFCFGLQVARPTTDPEHVARTGEHLSSLVFHEEVMKELQAEMYDLHVSRVSALLAVRAFCFRL